MDWLWPACLLLLLLLPAMIAAYVWILRRRRRFALRYSSLALVRAALPRYSWLRRHLPFVLIVLATGSMAMGVARPVAKVQIPTGQATILLALDVSGSMCSADIPPSRIEAAKAAALRYIEDQAPGTQIGIVAFSGFAELVQPPTSNQDDLKAAIRSLFTGRGTAIGNGILTALDAIAEIDPNVAPTINPLTGEAPTPVAGGEYAPEIIVVLTDGVTTTGVPPLVAAQQAADRGVRVYTIGFGTANAGPASGCGQQSFGGGGGGFGSGFGGGGNFRRAIDEGTLQQVAAMTGGDYYTAESAGELQKVFEDVPTSYFNVTETTEISVAFAAASALLIAVAMILSMWWRSLP